jgi:hypothetical protein
MKSQLRSHLMESYWNGHLETDLAPKMQLQHNFEPLRTQTLAMVASAVEDGSLMEALKKAFGSDATPPSPTRARRDPRKLEVGGPSAKARESSKSKSPVPREMKSPHHSQRHTPELALPTQEQAKRPQPPSLVPFAEYYRMVHCTSNVCQGMAYALFPKASQPHSPRSPDSPAPKKKRGAAALMRSLKSGEVSKIVDEMEAKDASEARLVSWSEYYKWHFKGSHVIAGLNDGLFQTYVQTYVADDELEPARPSSSVIPLPTPPQLAGY